MSDMKAVCVAVLLFAAAGCTADQRSAGTDAAHGGPVRIALSVPGRSNAAPSAAAFGKTAAVVWTASNGTQSDLYVSVSEDSGATFRAPVRVNDIAGDVRASGEQPARIAIGSRNAMHVVWPSRQDGLSVIRYAGSTDGGKTFTKAETIAGSGLTGARGWHALTVGYDGGVQVVWLDGRNATVGSGHAGHRAGNHGGQSHTGAMTAPRQDIFHSAWSANRGHVENAVATHVCFCCKTAVAASGEHVYAAWRHIFPGGVRDIAIARSDDNGATFGDPTRVSNDGWKIDACPDDGPAMVADGHGRLHLAWPTMVQSAAPRKAIFYSSLADDGRFTPRLRLDAGDGDPAHPQIASDEHGSSAIVWDEIVEGARRIALRRITNGEAAAVEYFDDRGGSYPAVAAADGNWVVVWSSHGPNGEAVIAGRQLRFAHER
jgi:hypothetical protein